MRQNLLPRLYIAEPFARERHEVLEQRQNVGKTVRECVKMFLEGKYGSHIPVDVGNLVQLGE